MFWPSENAVRHLCNALHALPAWYKLFEDRGLITPKTFPVDEYSTGPNVDNPEVPYAREPTWQELKVVVDESKRKSPEQLRTLCSDLLRHKDELSIKALGEFQKTKFIDSMAEFEGALGGDGYRFDGFCIVEAKQVLSIAQIADEALSQAFNAGAVPGGSKLQDHWKAAIDDLNAENYNGCLMNLRLILKDTLEEIAKELANRNHPPPRSDKENEIRDYLEKEGFLSKEEKNGISGIYGLLSAGPHGKGDLNSALFGYTACLVACFFVQRKFQSLTIS